MNYFAHETAVIDEPADIGDGSRIWHFTHVMSGAKIGENCILGQNVYIGSRAVLGNNVKIQNGVSIYDGVILEDDVFCGPSMVFTNVINPRSFVNRKDEFRETLIRKGASIGANATVVCGVTIGRYAMIGAGCVITRDVAPFALVYGTPGRFKGWICKCGISLPEGTGTLECGPCGAVYTVTENECREQEQQ